jgi:7-cyano-7-deazaguanine synthase
MMVSPDTALVLFSGGQDSTVYLAWALQRFCRVETIGFDYGQRHSIEMSVRPKLREGLAGMNADWSARLGDDHVITLDALGAISETALTRNIQIETDCRPRSCPAATSSSWPSPGRWRIGAAPGTSSPACAKPTIPDTPDCCDDTIKAMQLALGLGMDRRFVVHTPLVWIDNRDVRARPGYRWTSAA